MRRASSCVARQPDPAACAPGWFSAALADAPDRRTVLVDGAEVEVLVWGSRGQPGLLLLHGFSAHADWWSFMAPLLRQGRRVVSFSLSGMGLSAWRESYTLEQYAREALAVADATGLFGSPQPPLLIAHSFGTFVARTVARQMGGRLGGLVLVDGVLAVDEDDAGYDGVPRLGHRHRVYARLEEAVGRFRLSPPQPCENGYIIDFLARTSLRQVDVPGGGRGWSWCFDPDLRAKFGALPAQALMTAPTCRTCLMFGERSMLLTPRRLELLRRVTPRDTGWVEIPDAGHHVLADQPLALVAALRTQIEAWQPLAAAAAGTHTEE
jgi:pimeloyl-ACP methyl ester carboxylesterase